MKLKTIIAWILGIGVVVLIALPKLKSSKKDMKMQSMKMGAPVLVSLNILRPEILDSKINATGTILPNEEALLSTGIAGRIVGVYFQEGRAVSKGQLLVKIDDSELQAELNKLKSKYNVLEQNEQRQQKLFDKGGVSQAELDMVKNEVTMLRADLSVLRSKIEKTEVRAPFSGVLGLKNISPGTQVNVGESLVTIQDISKIKIEFSIPERYASQVRLGDKLRFSIEGMVDTLVGTIAVIDPKIDIQTRTFKVRGIANNLKGKIIPGAFASVTLNLQTIKDALLIPSDALVPDIRGYNVYVYGADSARIRPVKLGLRLEKQVQIVDGLSAGDSLITTGIIQLKPNAAVRLK